MRQDLCRPERTHRGLSLAFIRRGEGGEEKDNTGRRETETQRRGARREGVVVVEVEVGEREKLNACLP